MSLHILEIIDCPLQIQRILTGVLYFYQRMVFDLADRIQVILKAGICDGIGRFFFSVLFASCIRVPCIRASGTRTPGSGTFCLIRDGRSGIFCLTRGGGRSGSFCLIWACSGLCRILTAGCGKQGCSDKKCHDPGSFHALLLLGVLPVVRSDELKLCEAEFRFLYTN